MGESAMTVYLVSPVGEWKEIARFALKVSTEKIQQPSADNNQTEEKPSEAKSTEAKPAEQTQTESKPAKQTSNGQTAEGQTAEGQAADPQQPQKKILGFDKLLFTPALTLSLKSQVAQSSFPEAGVSQRSLSRLFRAGLNVSPADFVERVRIDLARRRLLETDDSIEAIAIRCGFGSLRRMDRAFARAIATSPTDFRARFKSNRAQKCLASTLASSFFRN